MPVATIHVNFEPLDGDWDGQNWDQQSHRCSNNFLSGPVPTVPPAGANNLVWQIAGLDDPTSVVFNVTVDLPGDDKVIFTGLTHESHTTYLPDPAVTDSPNGVPHHNGVPLHAFYQRGIYISSVFGASRDFRLTLVGAQCGPPSGEVIGVSAIHGGTGPITVNVFGTRAEPQKVRDTTALDVKGNERSRG